MSKRPTSDLRTRLYDQFVADFLDGDATGGVITVGAGILAEQVADVAAYVLMEMLGLHEWGEDYYCHPLHEVVTPEAPR
jgi:hypothetical protein